MAPLTIPPELKRITQYIRRAEELDNDKTKPESRLVAYYCRQYAVQSGISLTKSDASRNCLGDILAELEEEKEPMNAFSKDEANIVCRNFAVDVFDKADAEDRRGASNKGTAKTFYAAAVFLEVLEQFYDDDDDALQSQSEEDVKIKEENKQKRLYAKWKATEILKAIKDGREIVPGGYGEETTTTTSTTATAEEDDEGPPAVVDEMIIPIAPSSGNINTAAAAAAAMVDISSKKKKVEQEDVNVNVNVDAVSNAANEGSTEVDLYGSLPPPPAYNDSALPVVPMAPPPTAPAPVSSSSSSNTMSSLFGFSNGKVKASTRKVSKEKFQDAKELAQFALVAIDARDVDLAATRLQQALQALGR